MFRLVVVVGVAVVVVVAVVRDAQQTESRLNAVLGMDLCVCRQPVRRLCSSER